MNNNIIAVLMTVHNRRNITLECLKHLYENKTGEGDSIHVYMVDDGCTDGTPEAVKTGFPQVKIISGDGNLYWNRGMIRAWEEAMKDNPNYFLLLNDDTLLFPEAVRLMLNAVSQTDSMCLISGATKATKSDSVTYGGRIGKETVVPNGTLQRIDLINANCLLVPREVYDKIGMLDSYFHHSMGDWEYGLRASKAGIKNYLAQDYIGTCDLHEVSLPKCYNPKYTLKERLKYLSNPLAPMPNEVFYFCYKCYGLKRAIQSSLKIIVRTIFPQLF